ncbi:sorting nexin-19 isoform X1 [Electrophorus electricus]|uniref:Sorting nexin-19 n=1 Tax=Electrophorus electricus TaxID=8005 RepID=A0A4W4E7A6_ELEEL|nr:sorting nexin-19 isoform X1 [Electrophorus electricus]XP_035390123.1 sorting nexin-19 isoform X1 [Electrophorus electricus]
MSQPERLCTSEFMMQRKLLGFGAFVAWMILFHLLVNVWLLCLFTSLLVVIGGWLGSQAVLDSESVIHLEHFVTLDKIQSSAESELQLDHEIQNTVSKIIRDFVSSWYNTVSSEREFEEEIHNAMISMAMELKRRAQKVDRKALTLRTLDLCGCHLQSYIRAKEIMAENASKKEGSESAKGSLWDTYSACFTAHPALQGSTVEVNYARAIVDLLLHVLVPPPHLETRTGRFVVCELITCNILLPLIGKLSDPDWLNMSIVDVFNKSNKPEAEPEELVKDSTPTQVVASEQDSRQDLEAPPSLSIEVHPDPPTVSEVPMPELAAYDVIDSTELYCPQNMEEESRQAKPFPAANTRRFLKFGKSNPFYQETDADLESPVSDFRRSSLESLVLIGTEEAERLRECPSPAEGVLDLEEEVHVSSNTAESSCPEVVVSEIREASDTADGTGELSSSFCALQEIEKSHARVGLGVEQSRALNHSELMEPPQVSSPSGGTIPLSPFTFEPLSSPEGPVIIQNLRITGTITAKEHRGTGSHPYTLYTVKYETAVDSENPGTVQPVAYHMVNRRYSEFLNLQTRLEEKSELRKILKHVKGPKKIFPDLPFGNMDSDKVEARKSLLETFLRQLCAVPETANSEEMQEFLALNTDARIAFVKKPFIVSRIDKIVVNAIVDTLKTAFPRSEPQSPTEEVDTEPDGKLLSDRKAKSRMRFASKVAPTLHVSDMRPQVLYCFDEFSTVCNGFTLNGLERFISEKESLVSKVPLREAEGEGVASPGARGSVRSCTCREEKLQHATFQKQGETLLADSALGVVSLLMKDQWSWLCTQNIQKAIRLLFGTLLDRWLEVGVTNLTCRQYWVIYLQVLQEAVWPGGRLRALPRVQPTQQQRDQGKRQCLHCLMKLLPDLVSDMLGAEKYMHTWHTVLDSLQDPTINRHLVYCIWDLLIEVLIPELSEDEFQKTLLHSISKNAEKLPP